MPFVMPDQVDHRLAAVAALTVQMLEQVQRQRPAAVEQQHVALLQIEQIARAQLIEQLEEPRPKAARHQPLGVEHAFQLRRAGGKLLARIAEQQRQDLEGIGHQNTSVGVSTVFFRVGPPNRLASLMPSEQPLPKEKPQPPRRS